MQRHILSFTRLFIALFLVVSLSGCELPERAGTEPPLPARTHGKTLVNSLDMLMVLIPAGEFDMGSPEDEPGRLANEGPRRRVTIGTPFYIGAHEVTVGQFAAFVADAGYVTDAERDAEGGFGIDFRTGKVRQMPGIAWRNPGFPEFRQGEDHPVLLISWNDAEAFCRWLTQRENRIYRLPTEAEWEYAARGGRDSAFWSGSDPASLAAAANVADQRLRDAVPAADWAETWDDGHAFTAPVGSYPPNPFGLHDMHGNVWEWVADWHSDGYYTAGAATDPRGPESGSFRAIRGGGWFNPAAQNRAAQRIYFAPSFRYCLLSGFRVVMQADRPGSASAD
jgi:formylglycine-generating enzyme required for sulfatase activity